MNVKPVWEKRAIPPLMEGLTLDNLEAWAGSLPPDTSVGQGWSGWNDPVANFLKGRGYLHVVVTDTVYYEVPGCPWYGPHIWETRTIPKDVRAAQHCITLQGAHTHITAAMLLSFIAQARLAHSPILPNHSVE
jgi:hypothetical protein